MEIKTNSTHKSARMKFANTARTKITAALAVGSAVLVMFSGCQSLANEKSESITQIPSTTFADALKNFESTNKNNISYTIPEQSTTTVSHTTLNNDFTSHETTSQVEITQMQNINTYEQLLEELNLTIENKNFDSQATKLILETFEALYENYDKWKQLYKDLPSKEEYIRDKLINSLNYVNEINVYEYGTQAAEKVVEENGNDTFTTYDNKITITISENGTNLEKFLHEMIHIEQNKEENESKDRENYFYDGADLSRVFREGEATFNQVFVSEMSEEKNQFVFRENEKGHLIYYGKTVECGYSDYLYIYNNLVYLVGYKNLNIIKGENVFEQVGAFLEAKYGKDGATEVLDAIANWEKTRPGQFERSDEAYNSAIELQKIFNKYIIKDINNLKTDKQIQEYANTYERYKEIVLPKVIGDEFEDITNSIFQITDIDKALQVRQSQIEENGNER